MKPPENTDLPLYTYGLFKPGQLGYYQIQDCIDEAREATIEGKLLERDGTPLLIEDRTQKVEGHLLIFKEGQAEEAYKSVTNVEPEKQYRWVERTVDLDDGSRTANLLLGRNPTRGSTELDTSNWEGSNDPLFTDALDVVEEVIHGDFEFDWKDKKPFFRLHMAYLLLWSSIERYISLRYGLRGRFGEQSVRDKMKKMAEEPEFQEGLEKVYSSDRPGKRVVRAGRPQDSQKLDPEDPIASLDYYYQVRSNLSHRGKSAPVDFDILQHSLKELYKIFRDHVLPSAFKKPKSKHKSQ